MIIPVIFDPCAFYDYRYLWVYLKNLYHCFLNKCPIIAEEEYKYYKKNRPDSNVYEESFCKQHQYKLLSDEEENAVEKFFIPNNIYDKIKENDNSKLGAKIHLLSNRYKPLEKLLFDFIKKIKNINKKNIDGFLTWGSHPISLDYVAHKLRLKVITTEFSIRFPEYYPLSYYSLAGIYGGLEISVLYNTFKNTMGSIKDYFLTRQEIFALFADPKLIIETEQMNSNESFDIGIAGCHPIVPSFWNLSKYTDIELIQDVRNNYREEDIIFRKHPGDEPYSANYNFRNYDRSECAAHFIRKCKRIAGQGTNTLLEALLLGKTIFSPGVSPFSFLSIKSLSEKQLKKIDDKDLNFIFFIYLSPYNKMWNEEYLLWRLGKTDLSDIFMYHLKYYLREQKIPFDILNIKGKERLKEIIRYRLAVTNE